MAAGREDGRPLRRQARCVNTSHRAHHRTRAGSLGQHSRILRNVVAGMVVFALASGCAGRAAGGPSIEPDDPWASPPAGTRDADGAQPHKGAASRFEIARVRAGQVVGLRSRPRGPVDAKLDAVTEFGSPQTFAVLARKKRWLGVATSTMPNGRLGWLRENRSIRTAPTSIQLRVDLSRRRLLLHDGSRVRRRMPIGIGRRSSPTPTGRFAVTDELAGAPYGSYYGCCILVLSAHQLHLPPGWQGGDRIAIHGSPDSGSIGASTSAGCLHARESDLRALFRAVPLGAPVVIHP